ncbi:PREDICTED: pentatricopeptide repeat-containing protein At1g61870, mitochondrial [Theobroma cacao]|uniref:Pentatricopeptide repeat-containing protein At1g61870, mitochondrial n=2 Tax=Theobroma cacao TaxID=3641 RepID=A0AB32V154_THECC|nr:PREDICTED: pentatricopeptide repeat-containing protein At1g61870, mitochondrial [Theobroma cacao]EOY28658.1 Pentatricopeptide repeat 336 [Theobroma cacao]
MALLSRVRASTTAATLRLRHFSILSPDSSTPLTSHQKTRAALSLLKSEQNPDRILEICRAASLTPASHLDRITFSVAISKLSEGKHFQSIDTFLHELRSRPDLQNERFASHSLILYGQAKMLNHALTAFDEFYNEGLCRSAKSLNALLVAGIVSKDYEEVKRIFVEFPKRYGIEPDLECYNSAIKAMCESGSSSSAYSILVDMKSKGVQPNATTFGTLLAGFYKEEKYEDVGKVLNLMKEYGVPVGVSTYNTRIQSLCMLKKSTEAKALLDGMLSRGMKPNTVTYNNLIHGFCKEGNLEEAKRLFKSMRNSGLEPDSQCYFTLVHFSCQGGDFEAALSICKESMEKNWVPSFSSMKSLVNGLSSMSKVEEAKELIQKVKEKFSKNADLWDEVEKSLPQ